MFARVSTSAPRPRQIVQVGVVGHRPNRIASARLTALPDECRQVLHKVKRIFEQLHDPSIYSEQPTLLRIISPLAEGADRIVAQAGLDVGAELQCPLPFHISEYMLDFEGEASKQEFHNLLNRAYSVFQIDGVRSEEGRAYEQAGQVVIAHCDFLLAIWDGEPGRGRGGTEQIINEALQQNIPVVWVHAVEAMTPVLLMRDKLGRSGTRTLDAVALSLATAGATDSDRSKQFFRLTRAYYSERRPLVDGGRLFSILRTFMVKGKLSFGSALTTDYIDNARREWESAMPKDPSLPTDTKAFLLDRLCPYYAWADGLSMYYGGLFRSSSMATNLLSAFAVLFSLLGLLFVKTGNGNWWSRQLPSFSELILIIAVLSITSWGRRRSWHGRWLNYRQLAERLRQYFFLAPLGCALPTPRETAHIDLDPEGSWVGATFRAITRDLGLAPGIVDQTYLASMGKLIDTVLRSQVSYHDNNHKDMEKLKHRLHQAGTALFVLTLVACCAHVIGGEEVPRWIHVLTIAPPAFGAAFYAITNHGEFARSADRSLAMSRELERRRTDLQDVLQTGTDTFTSMRGAATRLAETMIAETLDWNTLFRYRQLNLPG